MQLINTTIKAHLYELKSKKLLTALTQPRWTLAGPVSSYLLKKYGPEAIKQAIEQGKGGKWLQKYTPTDPHNASNPIPKQKEVSKKVSCYNLFC